jgi:hypothetical protein
MTRETRLPWRRIGGALPAVVLIGAGTALAATGGSPLTDVVADSRPLVTVPSTPLDHLDAPVLPPLPAPPEQAPTPGYPGYPPGSAPASMMANGIPARALEAYQRAATLVDAADPGCRIDWALIAAIGKVESNHGRYGGNGIDSDGTVRPGIYGIPLNGANSTAVIHDSDGGTLDRDTTWDRAVGPMQFIPSTWRTVGVDANGDGRKDPQNMTDAATATAVYLCSGPGDLSTESDARSAVLRYNQSDAYADQVLAIAQGYRGGYTVEPGSALTPEQRTGSPYLPSGDQQTMARYDSAAAARPAPSAASKPAKGSAGSGAAAGSPAGSSGGSGSSSTGSGTGSGGSGGSGGSLTGTVTGTVGGVVGGVTGQTPAPNPSPKPSPSPSPSPTSATVVLPVIGPLGVPVCPTGYLISADGKSCTKI